MYRLYMYYLYYLHKWKDIMELNIVATILYITLYCSSNEFIKLRIRKVNPKLIKLLKIVDGDGGLELVILFPNPAQIRNKDFYHMN